MSGFPKKIRQTKLQWWWHLLGREATGWGEKANEVWLFYMTNFKGREKRGIKLEREKGLNSEGYYEQYEKIRMWIMRRASLEDETKKTE